MFVSIIIPAYKQENSIKEDISRIHSVMSQTRFDFEIVVVVDGFLDDTFEQAKSLQIENLVVIGYKTNRGKGYAVRYGMARAQGDFVAFIDAGMEIDPNGISMILEHMLWYDADIIVGSKRHLASKVNYPTIRRVYSWGYYLLVRLLFRLHVTDTQTGLKVYKREVLEKVLPRLVIKEYAFDIELLAVAKYLGYTRIFDAPVTVSLDFGSGTRLKSKLFLFDNFVRGMLYDTIAVFYRMYFLRYYHNDNEKNWIHDTELQPKYNATVKVSNE